MDKVNLSKVMIANGINVERLRNVQLCSEMEPYTMVEKLTNEFDIISTAMEDAISSRWFTSNWYCYGMRYKRKLKKYSVTVSFKDDDSGIERNWHMPLWDKIHGKHRKELRFRIKKQTNLFYKEQEAWDKYCGRDDVIRVYARIGGPNWKSWDGLDIEKHPCFLEKVDSAYDSTYCSIYFKVVIPNE